MIDAYHPLLPPLTSTWDAYDRTLAPGTVEAEVGIAAALSIAVPALPRFTKAADQPLAEARPPSTLIQLLEQR